MSGLAELRLPDLYREGDQSAPEPGMTASLEPYQVREMEAAVRAAMRAGRVSMEHGREELRLLSLCAKALRSTKGIATVPVVIHDEPFPVRKGRAPKGEKSRQKKARRANRRQKKRKR